jgi:hypothetical protein
MSSCADCCDSCQNCVNCNDTCDTCQSFCEIGKQLATSNGLSSPWPKFERDQIIIQVLPKETYNKAWDYVSQAARLGSRKNSGAWSGTPETRDFIYADKTNELITGIESLGGGTKVQGIERPFTKDTHIIYAKYFNAISEAMNQLLLHESACNECNVSCDVDCDTCDSCDSCQGSVSYWPSSWYGSWSGSWSGSGPGT